ncbi:MAG: endonuclease, partial [Bacteroidales bacterium]|nr:endonuclease [Bacteroidales bacterium]
MKNFKNIFAALLALSLAFGVRAAAPSGYYTTAEGKSGKALLEQLCTIISSHTTISYNNLWTAFKTTDLKDNGKIWDMYSTKEFSTTEKCGNYGAIGDCYNREHSFPKSWFNDASPMYSDLFHLYPTDGYVNNQRSNYPFGECANGERVPSKNGVNAL